MCLPTTGTNFATAQAVAQFEAATQRWLPLGSKQFGVSRKALQHAPSSGSGSVPSSSSSSSSKASGGQGGDSFPMVNALAWDASRNLLFVGGR